MVKPSKQSIRLKTIKTKTKNGWEILSKRRRDHDGDGGGGDRRRRNTTLFKAASSEGMSSYVSRFQ